MRFFVAFLLFFSLCFGEFLGLSVYKDQNISNWLVSYKLDGIRAYWDGKNLLSRNGKIINAPAKFIKNLPPFELDGELFLKNGEFEKTQSIIMDKSPNLEAWSEITYHVFDVPKAKGGLLERLSVLSENDIVKIIKQTPIKDKNELMKFYQNALNLGYEGVVLREPNAPYEFKRSKNALKFKPFFDAECEVVSINKGSGKFKDVMGSVSCKDLKTAKTFKIGSGFSDFNRVNPPKIGQIITYKYQNLTAKGLPRFPTFLRFRKD
ncbi:DNA ligase [Campylobacter mucosalis]|uniref:DNA ligase n=1 Tax=Campylobacter mucosalis TaxID=202 RepID=UPI001470848A|nr:DNA ligase [Campylobacter mucosalis]